MKIKTRIALHMNATTWRRKKLKKENELTRTLLSKVKHPNRIFFLLYRTYKKNKKRNIFLWRRM